MNKRKNKKSGFTLIELLTVITIIGILFGLAFTGADVALTAAAKAEASNNMKNILQAYISFQNDNGGGIIDDLEGEEMVDTSADDLPTLSGSGTNHTWAAILAQFQRVMNDANLYMIDRDKTAKRINKRHNAQVILDPTDEEKRTMDQKFQDSMLSFNMFVGLEESEAFGAGKTPVIYTAGYNATEGEWDKDAPHGRSGGHIGFLDGSVTHYKRIREEDFYRNDDPSQNTMDFSQAVYGLPLGHSGVDSLDGERE
jgi:prepilin-type N-terminal cleavage/methylation domain-containing protein/prepilin-type processing-associated H-X9-DG protein